MAYADIDGNGEAEDVMLTERDGGQTLWVCGPAGGRSIELEFGVWYLAVTDVEPDGVDEIFLGAADFDDAPGTVNTKLHWIHPEGDGLAARTEDFAGVWIGPTSGAGCVDADGDGDGVRELVQLWTDTEASSETMVVWHREISDALPVEGDFFAVEGEFAVGRDDNAIELLSTFSCGDELVELTRVRPPATICGTTDGSSHYPLAVDLDGDGLEDLVTQRNANAAEALQGHQYGGPAVAVCLGSGLTDEVRVGGMGEIFDVGEGPGDQPIIWTGGTTVSAGFSNPMVIEGDRLVFVRTADDLPLTLWDGYQGTDPASGGEWGASGCGVVADTGVEEFVQVVATVAGDQFVWSHTAWELSGSEASAGSTGSGSIPLPADFDTEGPWEALDELAPDTCG